MRISGMCAVQAKRNGEPPLYNSVGVAANEEACCGLGAKPLGVGRCLDGVIPEPFPSQVGRRLWAGAQAGDQRSRPLALGRERRERVGSLIRLDTVLLQQVPDALVAVASLSEGRGPSACVAAVVDVTHPLERLQCLRPPGLVHPGPRESLVELPPRAVAVT